MTNYYFLQICFIYYLYNFILQSSLRLKTYMSTRKWSDYISRDSAKPALPWLTSLETNVWVLFMRRQAVTAVGGRGKSLSWELLFQAKVEGHCIYTRACWQCALQHPYLWAANPLTQGPAKGLVPPPAKVQAFSPQEASFQNSDDKILTWFPPGPRE